MSTQLEKLKSRIPYDSNKYATEDLYNSAMQNLLDDSEFIALSHIYPYEDYSSKELPSKYYNWQLRACVELYNLAGNNNISQYSENGLSWSLFSDGLSAKLMEELIPHVGVPKVVETTDDTSTEEG